MSSRERTNEARSRGTYLHLGSQVQYTPQVPRTMTDTGAAVTLAGWDGESINYQLSKPTPHSVRGGPPSWSYSTTSGFEPGNDEAPMCYPGYLSPPYDMMDFGSFGVSPSHLDAHSGYNDFQSLCQTRPDPHVYSESHMPTGILPHAGFSSYDVPFPRAPQAGYSGYYDSEIDKTSPGLSTASTASTSPPWDDYAHPGYAPADLTRDVASLTGHEFNYSEDEDLGRSSLPECNRLA